MTAGDHGSERVGLPIGLLSAIDTEAPRRQREAVFVEQARRELEQAPIEVQLELQGDAENDAEQAAVTPEASSAAAPESSAKLLPPQGRVPAS